MADLPWIKFYPADWRSDPALRMCSLAARGLWMEMLALMHEARPRGLLLVNGKEITMPQLSALAGCSLGETETLCAELESAGVFSRKKNGIIYSRRIEKDENLSRKNRENGKLGGSPTLSKQTEKTQSLNPPDKGGDKAQRLEARDYIGEERKEEPKKVLPKESRGTRLPENFEPDETCQAIADQMALTSRQSQIEFEKFKDYWRAKSGAAGIKLDWQATFRNWLRNANPRGSQNDHQKNSVADGFAKVRAVIAERERRELEAGGVPHEEDVLGVPRLQQSLP